MVADRALKTDTRWTYAHLPDGTIQWTSPTGRTFISEPATIIRAPRHEPQNPEKKVRRQDPDEPAPF